MSSTSATLIIVEICEPIDDIFFLRDFDINRIQMQLGAAIQNALIQNFGKISTFWLVMQINSFKII